MLSEKSPLLPLGVMPWEPRGPMVLHEVLNYAAHPGWKRARQFVLTMTGLLWVMLLFVAISVAAAAPRCAPRSESACTSRRNIHQQEPQDSTGVRSKLDYLASLGVNAVWLSPVFKSPMKDFGYDISDFRDVDPIFGTMADFKALVSDMRDRGMRLILDVVPNHSSDEHAWFQRSVAREDPYTDYYVWAKPGAANGSETPQPPNNWLSVFGGSAWEFHAARGEFYLHQFAREQPDLNFRNPRVVKEMQEVLRFWLEVGVSGFRVDAAPHLLEDEALRDEPRSQHEDARPDEYSYLEHVHTHGLPGVMDILTTFRHTLEEHAASTDGEPRLLLAEVYDSLANTMRYYGEQERPLADFPFNFLLVTELGEQTSAKQLKDLISSWMDAMPAGACANWVLGNHDKGRVASRVGPGLVDGMNMVALLLPGVAITYYGEEIGMQDTSISWEQTVDPAGRNAGPERFVKSSRDPQRTPMQWSDEANAGFSSSAHTWLPVNENHVDGVNVATQQRGHSHLNVYRALVRARDSQAVRRGVLNMGVLADGAVFAFTRVHEDSGFLVAVNLGGENATCDLREQFADLPETAELYTSSVGFATKDLKTIDTSSLTLGPKDAVVLRFKVIPTSPHPSTEPHEVQVTTALNLSSPRPSSKSMAPPSSTASPQDKERQ